MTIRPVGTLARTMKVPTLILIGAALFSASWAASLSQANPHSIGGSVTYNQFSVMVTIYDKDAYPSKPIRFFQGVEMKHKSTVSGGQMTFIVTAADALNGVAGDSYIQVTNKVGVQTRFRFKTIRHKIHPDFNKETKAHNIAIFSNRQYYIYTELRPTLPTLVEDLGGRNVELLSFTKPATVQEDDIFHYELRSINSTVISSTWCSILYPFSPIKTTSMCVSGWGGKGLTQDDVGAPLVYWDAQNELKLAGIATLARSWTTGLNFPLEVTDIRPYLDWINEEAEHIWN